MSSDTKTSEIALVVLMKDRELKVSKLKKCLICYIKIIKKLFFSKSLFKNNSKN